MASIPLLLLLFLGLVLPTTAQAEHPFMAAARHAVDHSPQVRAASASLNAASQKNDQARAAFMPTLSASANQGHATTRWGGGGHSDVNPGGLALSLTQPVYVRKSLVALEQTTPYIRAFELDLLQARQGVVLSTARVWVGLLEAAELLQLATKNRDVTRRNLEATQARHQVGEITRTDVSQAEARLAAAESEVIQAQNSLEVNRARFAEAVGLPAPEQPATVDVSHAELDRDLGTLTALIEERPDLQAARERSQVGDLAVELARADLYPTLAVNAGAGRSWDSRSTPDPTDNASVTASLSWTLFDGGMAHANAREARESHNALLANLDRLRQQARREVEEAWLNLKSARAVVEAYQATVVATEAATEGVRQEFMVGTRTALDLLDAQNELFKAQTSLARSRFNTVLARFSLLAALGRLNLDELTVQ
ncbi:MAG: TolC family outer membrane protein [Magnetococcus sp. WYHC-3]